MRLAIRLATGAALIGACSGPSTKPAAWEVVAEDQPGALLSVWASGPDNVWVVGGHSGTDGPLIAHFDGTNWTKIASGLDPTIDLWWVHGFDDGEVFVTGSKGTIASTSDGATFTKMTTPPGSTVFGLWGATATDVWAVGGQGATGGFAWRYDGSTWTAYADFPADLATGGTCWKVNGIASDNVWLSGTNGSTMHYDGQTLDRKDVADAMEQQESLFSIGVSSKRVVAVGGASTGALYESSDGGDSWTAPIGDVGILLSGVAVSETDAYAVGGGGTILHRGTGSWSAETPLTAESLHAAYIDPTGDVWAVGGGFNETPTMRGVLLHKGNPLQGSFP